MRMDKEIICVRGAGDLATGVIQKLCRSGYRVYATEIAAPMTIRRHVALSTAIADGEYTVEDITARKVEGSLDALSSCWEEGVVPVIIDPEALSIRATKPLAIVDAIIAKRNLGTNKAMAPITIGLGPGFSAPDDVDIVIETVRGHQLGQLIFAGEALPNTGTPGIIAGQGATRVIHAPISGAVKHLAKIGDWLTKGQPIFQIGNEIGKAPFDGLLRGLIGEGMEVKKGLKLADIDPRQLSAEEINSISDKARNLGGAVLEALLYLQQNKEL